MKRLFSALWLVITLIVMLGCGQAVSNATSEAIPRCGVGNLQGVCTATLDNISSWVFEVVVPNATLPYPSQDQQLIHRFVLTEDEANQFANGNAELRLPSPILVAGRVRRAAPDSGTVVAQLTLVSSTEINRLPISQTSLTTQGSRIPVEGETLDYAIVLTAGQSYHAQLIPLLDFASLIPPVYFDLDLSEEDYTSGKNSLVRQDIVFSSAYSSLKGRLEDASKQPLTGFRVSAFDALSRKVSTTNIVETPDATFELKLSPDTTPVRLRFEPIEQTTAYTTYDAFSVALADLVVNSNGDVIVLAPEARVAQTWGGILGDGRGERVSGALIRIKPSKGDGLVRVAQSDADGKFSTILPRGNYHVRITPSSASGLAIKDLPSLNVTEGKDLDPQHVYVLDDLRPFRATIIGADAFRNGIARWVPLDATSHRTVESEIDVSGAISSNLNPGLYDVSFQPDPPGTAAWFVWAGASFYADEPTVPDGLSMQVPDGTTLPFVIRNHLGETPAQATVRVDYVFAEGADKARFIPIAEQISSDGNIPLKVPQFIFVQKQPANGDTGSALSVSPRTK